jgi:hypothetical protein
LAARGGRVRPDPRWLASWRDLNKPARLLALLRVRAGCVLGDAALEERLRTALQEHGATLPNHKGPPVQHPTARWGFQSCGGIHGLLSPGEGPVVRKRAEEPQGLLRRLGNPSRRLSGITSSQTSEALGGMSAISLMP